MIRNAGGDDLTTDIDDVIKHRAGERQAQLGKSQRLLGRDVALGILPADPRRMQAQPLRDFIHRIHR